ncbi:MAG: primase [Alphaproteobacteria bacterium]|jgi:DNA primase|nr:primase [Alphaproteobacteria bacterium]
MRFPPQFLDELRARLPVSEVVGRRVKLRKAGREWKGLSPFNQEKTPSFFVNDQKMAWFDFSSGKNGTIFDFLMLTEGLSFPEAVERLALQAGMPLPKVSQEDEVRDQRRRTLNDIVELAAKFYEATLAARAGARARGYLADRGVDPAMQIRFRLGYAPSDRFALKEHLGKEGVSVEDMIEAGLLVSAQDIPVPYDRFRDRVMFPITDLRARVIAFGGRALDKDVPAKYLNSPETPLFHKGSTLYNIAAARAAAHHAGKAALPADKSAPSAQSDFSATVIAVEGYVDVIAMVSAGFEATVAPLGTALTADQLVLLWKMADEPILCFDGDRAGRSAAYRAVDLALPLLKPGKSLKFASLPEGQDPDDLVRAGGRDAVNEVIGAARPLGQVLWMRETEAGAIDTPERRAALEARVNEVTAVIGEESVRRHYRQDFGARLRRLFEVDARPQQRRGPVRPFPRGPGGWPPRPGIGGRRGPDRMRTPGALMGGQPYVVASPQLAMSSVHRGHRAVIPRREALILQAVVNHPWLAQDHLEELAGIEFRHSDTHKLKSAILDVLSHDGDIDSAKLQAGLAAAGHGELVLRVGKAITTRSVWGARADAAPADVLMTWNQLVALHRQWHSLIKELRDAEQALGQESTEANYSWLQDVKARLSVIDGTEALIEGFGASSGRAAQSF